VGTVITVMNMKGGVGKTTVAIHLAGVIALYRFFGRRRKVLLIDYDPQFNASQAFLAPKTYFSLQEKFKTTLSILVEDETHLDPYHLQVPGNEKPPEVAALIHTLYSPTAGGGLDIVPSTLDLMYVALGQTEKKVKPIEERFAKFIVRCRDKYDLVFIDCHPAGSLFTRTSLRNSDHVIIPVAPQRYAVRGVGLMMEFVNAKKVGPAGPHPHVLFNMTSRIGVSREEKEIRLNSRFKGYCMNETLKWYKAFSDPEGGRGFVWTSQAPYSTEAFRNLDAVAREFLGRIGV
jgi:cellulose biosynthesis protein BcsQ